ncbi:MAG: hypothetical protein IKJ43_00515 [Bacilli bacterium]|nr:hypothetical protein [Bacilli bacterium]
MKIYIIAGKARHGKDTTAEFIHKLYEDKKYINLSYGSYIKEYAKKISDWDGSEETKPRELLQRLGTDIIRNKIDEHFFIKRLCDDIKVYSYFFDVATISDARFPDEIDIPREMFEDVITIKVVRNNFETPLSSSEQIHRTETALNDYDNFDYIIENDGTLEELEEKVKKIVEKVEHER